ncbi:type II toxin-antitoxin system RelE/ParE family toxin [Desulfocurvibacter africanus]
MREFWRWRLGDHRILAKLEDDELLVLVVRVGNRNKVYDKP